MFGGYKYKLHNRKSVPWPRRVLLILLTLAVIVLVGMIGVRVYYHANLKPVSDDKTTQAVTVSSGMTVDEIGQTLKDKDLIRSSSVFRWYVASNQVRDNLLAGTYELSPSMSTPDIVSILTHGKIATNLITILPGQRIDQIEEMLINSGYSEAEVTSALDPASHPDSPVLADKPGQASLEGYLYPESFQKTSDTSPQDIISASLEEMDNALTPKIRTAFANQGLSIYQGITLASMVAQEAPDSEDAKDRRQVAQVFHLRLEKGMRLQSDPTAFYGSVRADRGKSLTYDTPYNTYLYDGLPVGPISNVGKTALEAVAFPASTNWLYFVAGDDGKTYFSRTLDEHEALAEQHCSVLCGN